MDHLKELLLPNTFNKCGYVGVFLWVAIGVILLGVFAEMDNGERSDFRCKAKLQEMDFVRAKCFEEYDKRHNKYRFPVYGFVLINFLFIGIVSAVYSQVIKSTIEEHQKESRDAAPVDVERQRPPETHRLFVAYCCQLMVRFALGIVAIVLQTQLLYPSIFPSDFNCDLSSPAANASAGKNSTTYQCHNQRARQKTVSMHAVIVVNGFFAVLIFIEFMAILILRVKRGKTFFKDSQFLKYYLHCGRTRAPQENPRHLQPRNQQGSQQEPLPLRPEQQDLREEPPQQRPEEQVPLKESPQERAEQQGPQQEPPPLRPDQQDLREEPPQQRPEQQVPLEELPQERVEQQGSRQDQQGQLLSSFIESLKERIIKDTETLPDLEAPLQANPGEGERIEDLKLDSIYTNLVLVPDRAKYDFSGHRQEQLKQYPMPEENLEPKRREDIIDVKNKKVLIVGRPGIGKTVFCTKFLRDWAKNKTQDSKLKYELAFLIKFRRFNSQQKPLSLRELLTCTEHAKTEHLPDQGWSFILKNPEKVLILFDGLDEYLDISSIANTAVNNSYNGSVEQTMPFAALYSKLANGKLLPEATVLTTARPTAVSKVRQFRFNRTFEIIGFTSTQVEEYVENFAKEYVKDGAEHLKSAAARMREHISTNINIFSLCYVPVNCFIVCSCLIQILKYFTEKGLDSVAVGLPTKLTQIYKMATKLFFFRHNKQYKDKPLSREEIEKDELPLEVEEKFKRLEKIAFDGVKERRLIFEKSEVQGLEDSALFHQLPEREIGPLKHEPQFCFLHLTMQEFLAAKHIVDTMNSEEQLSKFVSDHINKGEWHVVLQFLAGLLGERKRPIETFTNLLPVKTVKRRDGFTYWPTDSDQHLALTILKCLFESGESEQSHSVVKSKLEETGFNAVDFSRCDLAPSDCTAVVHVLKNVPQISRINLFGNHIGSLGCVEIRKLLDNGNCQLTELWLISNNIDDNGVLELCKVITNSKLTELDLSRNKITDVGVLELCKVITNSKLTELYLHNNKITDVGVLELCKVITNSKLTVLNLSNNKITDVGVLELCTVITNSKLTELRLTNNKIKDVGVLELCKVITNSKLTKLYLSNNKITDVAVLELCKVITNSKLTKLCLSNNKITDVGVLELCKVITNSKLTKLYLSNNKITDVGVNNFCDVLTNPNCKLTELRLGGNKAITAKAKQRIRYANPNCKAPYLK